MPKKPARNAFFFFMKELEPQLRREGRVLPNGMADVAEIAHPRYKVKKQVSGRLHLNHSFFVWKLKNS